MKKGAESRLARISSLMASAIVELAAAFEFGLDEGGLSWRGWTI